MVHTYIHTYIHVPIHTCTYELQYEASNARVYIHNMNVRMRIHICIEITIQRFKSPYVVCAYNLYTYAHTNQQYQAS